MRKILLADSDPALRAVLTEQLGMNDEFSVVEAETGQEALELASQEYFDALLLDVSLPDMEGQDLCRRLRRSGVKTPIIMLNASDGDAEQILSQDSGANDYVTKPFRLGVLLARLRAQVRHFENSEHAVLTIGPFTFKATDKLLVHRKEGHRIRLTEKESQILRYLYRAGEKAVSRETLLGEVWGYNSAVTTHTLETHIYRLRQKIEENPSEAKLLLTEGGGYRLVP